MITKTHKVAPGLLAARQPINKNNNNKRSIFTHVSYKYITVSLEMMAFSI